MSDVEEMVHGAGVRRNIARALDRARSTFDATSTRAQFEREGIRFLTVLDPDYPAALHTIYDPPVGFFVLGQIPPTGDRGLAVVGSRSPTTYGKQVTKKLVSDLVAHGLTIVSGFARGIDTVAHQAALAGEGQTVAILGSGLLKLYPRENTPLARAILDGHGCLLSEHHPLQDAKPGHFPARNRLISAISQGVLVIEAGEKSGSLITADQALEQGRDVYAVPGMITSPQSQGTLQLIQQGAKLVLGAKDILEDFPLQGTPLNVSSRSTQPHAPSHPPEVLDILQALGPFELHFDDLHQKTGYPVPLLHMWLLRMQLQGKILALPGNRYAASEPGEIG